ncbi:MAG: hypothetical protein GXP16_19165 [Gammaproteobacteria bacterium]|nr:hypothetical protein [Gammaproteobacteria bacterium]
MTSYMCIFLTVFSLQASARTPDHIDDLQRETRIVADVVKAALRDKLSGEERVAYVQAEYLAAQGVLLSVTLNSSWWPNSRHSTSFEINGRQISIPEIPSMVENILNELQVNIAPYEPEALEDLRDLRSEQRELRLESRQIRSKLRETRRSMIRNSEDGEDYQEDIREYEQQLATVDQQYEDLAVKIEQQYQRLRDYRKDAVARPSEQKTPVDLDTLIAEIACDYGPTLKSLKSGNFFTIALRRGKNTKYYAFKMEHINECSSRNMRTERLLELAYQYES